MFEFYLFKNPLKKRKIYTPKYPHVHRSHTHTHAYSDKVECDDHGTARGKLFKSLAILFQTLRRWEYTQRTASATKASQQQPQKIRTNEETIEGRKRKVAFVVDKSERVPSARFFFDFLSCECILCVSPAVVDRECLDMRWLSGVVIGGANNQHIYYRMEYGIFFSRSSAEMYGNTNTEQPHVAISAGADIHNERDIEKRRKYQTVTVLRTCSMVVFHFTSLEFPLVYYVHVVCAQFFIFFRSHSIRTRGFLPFQRNQVRLK